MCAIAACGTGSHFSPGNQAPVGAGECLKISSLDFGEVVSGCESAPQRLTLSNSCAEDVELTGFSLSSDRGPDGQPEFLMVASPAIPPGGGLRLSAQSSASFLFKYRPVDEGSNQASLTLDARTGDVLQHQSDSLLGKGILGTAPRTDAFVTDPPPKADFLVVIDNSPTMANDMTSVSTNLETWFQALEAQSLYVDFHVAVITADPADGAVFRSGTANPDKVLSNSSSSPASQFAASVNVGTDGTGTPMCFQQALDALTSPLVAAQNAGFLRIDASLNVICITNSNDRSSQGSSWYLDALYGIKGNNRRTMFTFNAIGGFSASCTGDTGALLEMVKQTNGEFDDICNPDWYRALERVGRYAGCGGWQLQFFLSGVPNGPVEVAIDGRPVPPFAPDGATIWSYDENNRSIAFQVVYAPGPSQTITVTYPVSQCGP
jgi:hypothetical protein